MTSLVRKALNRAVVMLVAGLSLAPATAVGQACAGVTLDPPVTGGLDFGRLYVTSGTSGAATLDASSGVVSATGRLVAAQAGAALAVRVTDAEPDCEFRLTITPSSQTLAPAFTAVADRIAVLEGVLVSADPGQREWVVRMTNGVARIMVGGRLEMSTSGDGLIDTYTAPFSVSVEPF